ncbi:transketolase [Hydrogenispora ethanolica]|uniref:Transketolase n=1 Tax=Hydrogenispora ethanolica TaxID=1082276 RepID=A0A4R1QT91_HYDET|nr:transketolase [Hydrogenispora ethanolica]TCL57126.1 transketolase [Hydrogenispora ethanolica]
MLTSAQLAELNEHARQMRGHIIRMLAASKSGHPGGSLSAVELLSYLYFYKMKIDPQNPTLPDRDRFVLSKGHAAPVLYSALAERGFFDKELLQTLRQFGSILQGHPDMKRIPGVDISSGSLGQGLSVGNGMALAAKLDRKPYHVYVLLGDGEIEEGQVWEALMTSVHYKLDNLTAFLDYNHLQIDGTIEDVKSLTDPGKRFTAFGWRVVSVDGHNIAEIDRAVEESESVKGQPTMIVLNTCKGKGCSFMENQVGWHGAAPKPEEAEKALQELGLA